MIWITLCPMVYFMTKEHGEKHGLASILLHLTVLTAGWFLGNWFGMLLISLPILGVYYNTLYYLSHVIVPASNPESKVEKQQRFWVFLWYICGPQHPLQVVSNDDLSGRNVEARISGNVFNNTGKPGLSGLSLIKLPLSPLESISRGWKGREWYLPDLTSAYSKLQT